MPGWYGARAGGVTVPNPFDGSPTSEDNRGAAGATLLREGFTIAAGVRWFRHDDGPYVSGQPRLIRERYSRPW